MSAHETLRRDEQIRGSSDRSFGLVFTAFFCVVAFLPVLKGHPARWWALPFAVLFLAAALIRPSVLQPLNALWLRVGLLLQKVVSPVILAVLFYGIFTPAAFLYRVFGKDLLSLRFDRDAQSYWISRTPPGPPAESMGNQF
jgi:hypothetical protein